MCARESIRQKMNTAILSSSDKYTTFSFGGKTLTFRTCNGLKKYTKIFLWDNGYIEVMSKYNKEKFLFPIKEVNIEYA